MNTSQTPADSGNRKPVVAIVFGGRSSEHAVSCATAASVLQAIDRDRYDVVPVGITPEGRWVLMPDDPKPLLLDRGHTPRVSGDREVVLSADPASRDLLVLDPGQPPRQLADVDVVFPLLHGPFGEDGTIQGFFELGDVRYVGSGVAASAIMMDKQLMKVVFASAGLPIARYVVVTDKQWRRDPASCLDPVSALGRPVFVKPARAGSSVGVVKVERPEQLREAIEHVRTFDPKVLIEEAIEGREVECGVLEGRGARPARVGEIGEIEVVGGHHGFYDFEAKYLGDDARLTCPANLPDAATKEIKQLSARAFDAAGCEGLARVDWFYQRNGRVVLNEINTMPGFTPASMFPRTWAAAGLDYPALITELIELALERRVGLR